MINPRLSSSPFFRGRRIGLLGGSFNPAHDGHRMMSLFALKRLGLDQVWWLVSPQNPLKPSHDMAPLRVRLKKAEGVAKHPRILVTAIEKELGTRYTTDTLKALRGRFPHTHFVWLMGADNLQQIPRWQNWPALFALVPIAVFRRPGYVIGCGMNKATQRFASAFRATSEAAHLALKDPPAWLVLDNPLNVASATILRQCR
jgi:nicotinate-nucleotide adenylyltransferase